MKKLLYILFSLFLLASMKVFAVDSNTEEALQTAQEKLKELGFHVFKEPVETPDFTLENLEGEEDLDINKEVSIIGAYSGTSACDPLSARVNRDRRESDESLVAGRIVISAGNVSIDGIFSEAIVINAANVSVVRRLSAMPRASLAIVLAVIGAMTIRSAAWASPM